MKKRADLIIGLAFAAATIVFIVVFLTNDAFFNWAFKRHHNVLSWYIRPLFIIPMVVLPLKKATPVYSLQFSRCSQACSGFRLRRKAISGYRNFWLLKWITSRVLGQLPKLS